MTHKRRFMMAFMVAIFVMVARAGYARIYILIDQPSEKRFPIAITTLAAEGEQAGLRSKVERLLERNLSLSNYFEIIPSSAFLNDPTAAAMEPIDIDFSGWKAIGAQALIKGKLSGSGRSVVLEWRLYDPNLGTQLVGKEYRFNEDDYYKAVHKFANEVVFALTGSRGIFETQIAAACGPKTKQQIVTFYADGTGRAQWTTKSHNLSPDWAPGNDKIAYMSYTVVKKAHRRPDLYLLDLGGKRPKLLSSRGTLNITPSFSPTGAAVAFASNVSGDSEIYTVDLAGKLGGRITNSWLIDLSPTWSPDASQLIFASERAGNLHLFKTDRAAAAVERLTFVGYQNDQPDWAPTGDKVAFTSRDRGRFDIFIMNPDGSKIERLTNQEGDNESPSWSPDGRYVTFSSTRGGSSQIYVMGWDGANPMRVGDERCTNPDWSGWESSGTEAAQD